MLEVKNKTQLTQVAKECLTKMNNKYTVSTNRTKSGEEIVAFVRKFLKDDRNITKFKATVISGITAGITILIFIGTIAYFDSNVKTTQGFVALLFTPLLWFLTYIITSVIYMEFFTPYSVYELHNGIIKEKEQKLIAEKELEEKIKQYSQEEKEYYALGQEINAKCKNITIN